MERSRARMVAFAGALVAFQVLLIFVHLAVYQTLAAAFGFDSSAARVIFVLLALTFVTASLLARRYRHPLAQWYYTFAAYWFGLINFLFIGGLAFFIIFNIFNLLDWPLNLVLAGAICFGSLFLVHLYSTWNSGRAEVVKISVSIKNVPEFWKQHPLVFVSDVHLGAIRGESFMRKVVSKIRTLNPAAVVVGGDLYDGVKCDAERIVEPLRALKPPKGVHYVTGNHEFYGEFDRYMAAIRGVGINILSNQKVEIEGLQFVGVDYEDTRTREDFMKILDGIALEGGKPAVLIKHEPEPHNLEVAAIRGFSLSFFGHTHQGQIYPLMYITRQMYNGFDYGLKRLRDLWVYTSSGVGTWGPPLRLGTKSEIVLVEFKSAIGG